MRLRSISRWITLAAALSVLGTGCQNRRGPFDDTRTPPSFPKTIAVVDPERAVVIRHEIMSSDAKEDLNDLKEVPSPKGGKPGCFRYTQELKRILSESDYLLYQTADIRVVDHEADRLWQYRKMKNLRVNYNEPSRAYLDEALLRYFELSKFQVSDVRSRDSSSFPTQDEACSEMVFYQDSPEKVPVPFTIQEASADSLWIERKYSEPFEHDGSELEISNVYMEYKRDPESKNGILWTRYHYFRSGSCSLPGAESADEAHILAVTTVIRGYSDEEASPYMRPSPDFARRLISAKNSSMTCKGDRFNGAGDISAFAVDVL